MSYFLLVNCACACELCMRHHMTLAWLQILWTWVLVKFSDCFRCWRRDFRIFMTTLSLMPLALFLCSAWQPSLLGLSSRITLAIMKVACKFWIVMFLLCGLSFLVLSTRGSIFSLGLLLVKETLDTLKLIFVSSYVGSPLLWLAVWLGACFTL